MKLFFLGAGKMATAIAKGLLDNRILPATAIAAVDVAPAARQAFTAATGVVCAENVPKALQEADVLLVAVKPQVAETALRPLAEFCSGKLIISICAGLPLARLSAWTASDRLVRVMPNTPLTVGQGASIFTCTGDVSTSDREVVRTIFGTLGLVQELPEQHMDAVTAVSGSGPAYVFEMAQALIDAGIGVGLPPEVARDLVYQTLAGAAEMLRRRLGSPDELRQAVTSPGGTTAAGQAVMDQARFRQLMANVVKAARDRAVELGRK